MVTSATIRNSRHFSWLYLFAVAGLQILQTQPLAAQDAETLTQREIARREAALPRGTEALARGKAAMQSQDFVRAHEDFRMAVMYLPDAVVSGKAHDDAVAG